MTTNKYLKMILYIIIICTSATSANSMSYMEPGGHYDCWVAMADVPLKYGGLGRKIPVSDFQELHDLIDNKTKLGSVDKRHSISHNPAVMSEIFASRWHKRAVFNAVAIHNVVDMYNPTSTARNKTGINGHDHSKTKELEGKKAYGAIINGEKTQLPEWSKKPGPKAVISKRLVDRYTKIANNAATHINRKSTAAKIKSTVPKGTTASILGKAIPTIPVVSEVSTITTLATGSGSQVMSTLAAEGAVIGGGVVSGVGVMGGAAGLGTAAALNEYVFDGDTEADKNARIATYVGAAGGTVASVGTLLTVGAGPSGLAAIGSLIGGGMAAGSIAVITAPVVGAVALGGTVYWIFTD